MSAGILVAILVDGISSSVGQEEGTRVGQKIRESLGVPDAVRRRDAVLQASVIGGSAALPLIQEAVRDPDAGVREAAVTALGHLVGEGQALGDILPSLLSALHDPHPYVRRAAAWALAHISDPRVVSPLHAATRDRAAEVRAAAVRALGHQGGERAVAAVRDRLRDKDPLVRREAARALGQMRATAAVSVLIERLFEEKEPEVRRAIVWALGEIGDPHAAEALRAVTRSPDPYVRASAEQALRRLQSGSRSFSPGRRIP